jgi:hypothetical protein
VLPEAQKRELPDKILTVFIFKKMCICIVEIQQIIPRLIPNSNELVRKCRPGLQHGGMKRNGTDCRIHKHGVKVSRVIEPSRKTDTS